MGRRCPFSIEFSGFRMILNPLETGQLGGGGTSDHLLFLFPTMVCPLFRGQASCSELREEWKSVDHRIPVGFILGMERLYGHHERIVPRLGEPYANKSGLPFL